MSSFGQYNQKSAYFKRQIREAKCNQKLFLMASKCQKNAKHMSQQCPNNVQKMSRNAKTCQNMSNNVQQMSDICPKNVRGRVPGRCQENVQKVSGKCPGDLGKHLWEALVCALGGLGCVSNCVSAVFMGAAASFAAISLLLGIIYPGRKIKIEFDIDSSYTKYSEGRTPIISDSDAGQNIVIAFLFCLSEVTQIGSASYHFPSRTGLLF